MPSVQQQSCEKFKERFRGTGPCSHPCLPLKFFKHLPRETSPHDHSRCLLPDGNQAFAYFWVCLNLTKNPAQNNGNHLSSMYWCCYSLDCVSWFALTTDWPGRRVTQFPSTGHNFACSVPRLGTELPALPGCAISHNRAGKSVLRLVVMAHPYFIT